MGNFSLVAFVALIGYGVFMTSILFPSHGFESWSKIIMMLIRPYLLLFAETGIEQFQCMYHATFVAASSINFCVLSPVWSIETYTMCTYWQPM